MHAQPLQAQQIPGGIILKLPEQLTTISKFSLCRRIIKKTKQRTIVMDIAYFFVKSFWNMADNLRGIIGRVLWFYSIML